MKIQALLLLCVLVLYFICLPSYASHTPDHVEEGHEVYGFKPDAYATALGAGTNGDSLERKKGKKKKGKKDGLGTDELGLDDVDFLPDQNVEDGSLIAPPLYPCDPPVCSIVDFRLPPEVCQNECEKGSHCQGRLDTRISESNIAVCVPSHFL